MKVSETALIKGCLEYLRLKCIVAWRSNSGRIPVRSQTKTYMLDLAPKGTSDIIGILPGGRFLAVECKVGKNKLTPAQAEFLRWVNNAGGRGIVVWSLEDLEEVIDEIKALALAETCDA